jgi:site-specific DNA-methyltransferase (adenine-specific)
MIHHGDCVEVMAGMDPESVDAIVTDPPYGLEFMGKEWDRLGATTEHPDDGEGPWGRTRRVRFGSSATTMQVWHQQWAEAAYRVAKPSAYLLAFGGTRTVHRMTVALEDAGWIIRDMLVWGYASGFPKSKASLKPAWEPIVMARKPGPLRMLAIDECRIPIDPSDKWAQGVTFVNSSQWAPGSPADRGDVTAAADPSGRWPANIVLTDPIFDGGVESVVGGGEQDSGAPHVLRDSGSREMAFGMGAREAQTYPDAVGTYSRFFLIPKAARSDREPVLGGETTTDRDLPLVGLGAKYCTLCGEGWVNPDGWPKCGHGRENTGRRPPLNPKPRANVHPTVKPTDLMRHLVRLVTPTGGTVLDPFLGSGTTALAAEMEGFDWIGIEREAEYVAIAEARLNGTQRGLGLEAS